VPRVRARALAPPHSPGCEAVRARLRAVCEAALPPSHVCPRTFVLVHQGLHFGYKQGCAFATQKCITNGVGVGSPPQFCVGDLDQLPSMCTANR
jgi:hypothetical protein